jgi:hypothetical protein
MNFDSLHSIAFFYTLQRMRFPDDLWGKME